MSVFESLRVTSPTLPILLKLSGACVLILPTFKYPRAQVKQITLPPSGFVDSQKGRDSQSGVQVMSIICIFSTNSYFSPRNASVSLRFTLNNPPS